MPELDSTRLVARPLPDQSADQKVFPLRVSGPSMSPFILDKDIVFIQRAALADLRIGTVVAYRTDGGAIVVHRVLGFITRRGRTTMKVRGDASDGAFTLVGPEAVMGRIVAVQRGRRLFAVDTWYWRAIGFLWGRLNPVGVFLLPSYNLPRKLAAGTLLLFQCSTLYRRLASRVIGRRIRYKDVTGEDLAQFVEFGGSGHEQAPRLSRSSNSQEFPTFTRKPRTFVALFDSKVAGYCRAEEVPGPLNTESCWMISGLWVRNRYRGAGIGRGLLIKAGSSLSQRGIKHMLAGVFDSNTRALALADRVGAGRPFLSELSLGKDAPNSPPDTVLLSSSLAEDLQILKQRGILEKYRGTGCCEEWL
jgi:hypothetical protein